MHSCEQPHPCICGNVKKLIRLRATARATLSMSAVLSLFMTTYLGHESVRRDRVASEKGLPLRAEDYTPEMLQKERDDGDNATFFRYTI